MGLSLLLPLVLCSLLNLVHFLVLLVELLLQLRNGYPSNGKLILCLPQVLDQACLFKLSIEVSALFLALSHSTTLRRVSFSFLSVRA